MPNLSHLEIQREMLNCFDVFFWYFHQKIFEQINEDRNKHFIVKVIDPRASGFIQNLIVYILIK